MSTPAMVWKGRGGTSKLRHLHDCSYVLWTDPVTGEVWQPVRLTKAEQRTWQPCSQCQDRIRLEVAA